MLTLFFVFKKFCRTIYLGINLEASVKINFNTIIMSVNFKPLADRVLVEPAPVEQKTASGIIIPDTAKEKPLKGTIIQAGLGKKDEPMIVKVGDQVLFGQYAGTEIKLEGKTFLIMRESDIYGIL